MSALLLAPSAAAQGVGFTLGVSQSNVVETFEGDGSLSSHPATLHAYTLGVTYRRPLFAGVALQPELLVVRRGWDNGTQPTLTTTYVELPVLLRIGAVSRTGAAFRPSLIAGGSVAAVAWCGLTTTPAITTEGSGCNQRIVAPYTEDYSVRRFDAGAVLGLGLDARLSGGTIVGIEGRFVYGLADFRREPNRHSRNTTSFVLVNIVP